MKKFFLTLIAIFALSSSCLAATQVRVSDYNLEQFFHAYNKAATGLKNNCTFVEFPVKATSGDAYDAYVAVCGQYGHGIAVGIFVNKEGYVAKINLSFNGNDSIARDCSSEVFFNVLVALGANEQELNTLSQQFKSKSNRLVVPCSALKRFIVVDVSTDANGVTNIRLIGAVK